MSRIPKRANVLWTRCVFSGRNLPNHRGFFYHWANINTGERLWDSGSFLDRYRHPAVRRSHLPANISSIPKSANLPTKFSIAWIGTGFPKTRRILPHGWTPETGFLQYRWDNYSEMMMMYLLGLGSSSHPLPAEAWDAWKRTIFEYDGIRYIGSFAPLFVHQYSQAWFDFRGKRDSYADYFQNSIIATDVHRRFCLDLVEAISRLQRRPLGYHRFGFAATAMWSGAGRRDRTDRRHRRSVRARRVRCRFCRRPTMRSCGRSRIATEPAPGCRYGFVDAFNPLKNGTTAT